MKMLAKFRPLIAISALIISSLGIGLVTLRGDDGREARTQVSAEAVGPQDESQQEAAERGQNGQPGASGVPALPYSDGFSFSDVDVSRFKTGALDLQLSLRPTCASHGDTITAFLSAVPRAYVAMQITYNSGQPADAYYVGPVGPDGSLTYPWVVFPQAREGQGIVFVVGHVEDENGTKRSGSVAATFRIANRGVGC